jgi:hypothetical protein
MKTFVLGTSQKRVRNTRETLLYKNIIIIMIIIIVVKIIWT